MNMTDQIRHSLQEDLAQARIIGAYRLSVAPDLSAFLPEIRHVCRLLAEAHGLVERTDAAMLLHYGPDAPDGAAVIPAHIFGQAIYAGDDGLHLKREALHRLTTSLVPPGTAEEWDARHFDAIGLAFLVASRVEERDHAGKDRYGRYPSTADFCIQRGIYGRAVVDEALAAIARLLTGRPHPAGLTRYNVKITHDVDRLRAYHYLLEPLRYALGDVLKRGAPRSALRRLSAYRAGEPWRSMRDLLDLSERHGTTSHFYFMGPSRNSFDSPYAATMTDLLRQVGDEIGARGHRFGFHPGYGTATDTTLWRHQRSGLEKALGRPVTEGRQHMLCYAAETTPDIWDAAGMTHDYTLAYPEAEGFRNGSCRAIPAYSLAQRRTLRLRQTSTPIMEFGLFGGKYRGLSPEQALDACQPVIDACRRHGGTLVTLYHTGQPTGPERKFYAALLNRAT